MHFFLHQKYRNRVEFCHEIVFRVTIINLANLQRFFDSIILKQTTVHTEVSALCYTNDYIVAKFNAIPIILVQEKMH